MLLVIFAVMMLPMLLMGNRQRKMMREQQERLSQLEIGDEVRTHSGFYGLIVDQYDDVVILETEDGSQMKWARNAISQKVEEPAAADASDDLDADDTDGDAGASHEPSGTDRDVPGVTGSADRDR